MEEFSSASHYGIAASVDDVCVQCKVRHRPGSGEDVSIGTSISSEDEQMLSLPLLDMTCILRRWEDPMKKVEIMLCPLVIELGPPQCGITNTSLISAVIADKVAGRSRAMSLSPSTGASHSSASSAASRSIQGSNKSRRRSYPKQQKLLYDTDGHHSINFPRIYSGCFKPPPPMYHSTLETSETAIGVDQQQLQPIQNHSTVVIPSTHIKCVILSTLDANDLGLGIINSTNNSPKLIQLVSTALHNSGVFFLYFTNINSYHVVRCFLSSCIEPYRFHVSHTSTDSTTRAAIPASPLKVTRFISKGRLYSSISTAPSIRRIHRQGSSFDMDKLQAHKMKDHVNNESIFRRARRKLSYVANSVGDWISSLRMTDCCVALDYQNYCSSDPCGSLHQTYNSTLVTKTDAKADFRSQRNLNGIISMEELSTTFKGEAVEPETLLPFSTSSYSDIHDDNDDGNMGNNSSTVVPQFSYEVVTAPFKDENKVSSLLVSESKAMSEEGGRKRKINNKSKNNYSSNNSNSPVNYDSQTTNSTPPILVANSSSSSITSLRSVDANNCKSYNEYDTSEDKQQNIQNNNIMQNHYSTAISTATEFKVVDL